MLVQNWNARPDWTRAVVMATAIDGACSFSTAGKTVLSASDREVIRLAAWMVEHCERPLLFALQGYELRVGVASVDEPITDSEEEVIRSLIGDSKSFQHRENA